MRLDIYVEPGCPSCRRAESIATDVREAYPSMVVNVIDVSKAGERPADVFAVPTFVLNGEVVSLGNPKRSELNRAIEGLLDSEVD